jgi:hypothetical protein
MATEYTVNDNGIITDLGKFEGEPRYVPYYWDCALQGMYAEDVAGVFFVPFDREDYAKFNELEGSYGIALEESEQGFVGAKVYDSQAEYNAAVERCEALEADNQRQTNEHARTSCMRMFDTSTIKGLEQAERFKARMENLYESVNVYAIGLNRVQIVALRPSSK